MRAVAIAYAHTLEVPTTEKWTAIRAKYDRATTNIEIVMLEGVITKSTRKTLTRPGRQSQNILTNLVLKKSGLSNVE